MRFCFVGTLLLIVTTPAYGAVVTGPITNPSNGHSYYKLSFGQPWTASEAEAQSLGGHLVTINDAVENSWVTNTFGDFNSLYWTGLNDAATQGTFVWSSGDSSSYRNWVPGHPSNNPGRDYVALLDQTHGQTDDTGGQWLAFTDPQGAWGIVEVVPEPTGLAVAVSAFAFAALGRRRPKAA